LLIGKSSAGWGWMEKSNWGEAYPSWTVEPQKNKNKEEEEEEEEEEEVLKSTYHLAQFTSTCETGGSHNGVVKENVFFDLSTLKMKAV
jgi:hypothetical protein